MNHYVSLASWEGADNLVSPQARVLVVHTLRCGIQMVILMFGIPANALNLAVFAKVNWTLCGSSNSCCCCFKHKFLLVQLADTCF